MLSRLVLFSAAALMAACAPKPQAAEPVGPRLVLPLACVVGRSCEVQTYVDQTAGPGQSDYRCGPRTNDGHNGVDFRIPDRAAMRMGVAVLAAADGRVARLRDGMADVSIRAAEAPLVAGQECGNGVVIDHGRGWESQYCHLALGSIRVKPGEMVRAGAPLARVGLSGDTEFAHLHLTIRHDGVVVDPFAPDPYAPRCRPQVGLWTQAAATHLVYRAGAVLNSGFAGGPVDPPALEEGAPPAPTAGSPALVAYVRAIGLAAGDVQTLVVTSPDGAVLARQTVAALDRDKAQYVVFTGAKRPVGGWRRGVWRADYTLVRGGKTALRKAFQITL